jgi:putative ABC transport system permease protein
MFEFLIQRLKNNKTLYGFLLIGAVIAVAIFSSIPMYSNGVLQRMLIRDLEITQTQKQQHPGEYSISLSYLDKNDKAELEAIEKRIRAEILESNVLPSELSMKISRSNHISIEQKSDEKSTEQLQLVAIDAIEDHISFVSGRLPKTQDDGFEVMVTEQALQQLNLVLDGTYNISFAGNQITNVTVVGVYTISDNRDPYWSDGLIGGMNNVLTILDGDMQRLLEESEAMHLTNIEWREFYDFRQLEIRRVSEMIEVNNSQVRKFVKLGDGFAYEFNMIDVLKSYADREKILKVTLWILTVPVLMITCFYTYMISNLIVKNDANEIAMLKSRGAGTLQIFLLYVVQSVFMGSVAFLTGPWLGYLICKIIGASNGFLQLVNRKSLPIEISGEVRVYALIASLIYVIFILGPALMACRTSIVQYKRKKNLDSARSLWEKLYLDVMILGITYYGYYIFNNTSATLGKDIVSGQKLDPLLFLIPTLFIVGCALVYVRLNPYIIRFIFWIGKKRWRPVMYYSMLNASRAEKNSKFITLFIVLFLSFGLLNASQARTLNQNAEDQVNYTYGADITIKPYKTESDQVIPEYWLDFMEKNDTGIKNTIVTDKVPYRSYEQLEGVDQVTKVLVNETTTLSSRLDTILNIKMMGVIPHEFAEVAWSRGDLNDFHLNAYMNVLTQVPNAVFLSSNLLETYDLKVGDPVELKWDKYKVTGIIYGFMDYFPTFNPLTEAEKGSHNAFALVNYNNLEDQLPVQEYDIWIKRSADVTDQNLLDQLSAANLETNRVEFRNQAMIEKKNDPMLQGTNGVLTMSYVITMLITIVGYLIFWIIAIRGRALKFGIFRAMGMTMRQVTMIIISEQLLMMSGAIAAGLAIGTLASRLFVPMLQQFDVTSAGVPPFRVVILNSDYGTIVSLTFIMLLVVLIILFVIVKRFKVNQVIKLGED